MKILNNLLPMRVILADVVPKNIPKPKIGRHFSELVRLIETLGGMSVVKIIQRRGAPSGKTYLGTGKADELGALAKELKADAVVINSILRGGQYLELTKRIPVLILDRVDVILKIFERHAVTAEAKLQVKRAQLEHDIPKIYGRAATTLFERERGGISATRGAGERGIEIEKRHIREQIKQIEEKISALKVIRQNQRSHRLRQGLQTIALVGYTNSGKSTLLRTMTGKKVLVADKLFATLDPRLGALYLPKLLKKVLLVDTIGFIENLPSHLIAAFRATLEEVQFAELILHIYDAADSSAEILRKQKTVQTVLTELACQNKPQIFVANKIDLLTEKQRQKILAKKNIRAVSAEQGMGLERLVEEVERVFGG
jgi:GTP-binding protein HflX